MAAVEVNAIQELLGQSEVLIKAIQTAGDVGRTKLQDIKVDEVRSAIPQGSGKVDAGAWSSLAEDRQNEIHQRLAQVRDALQLAAGLDGPTDAKHIMHATYAATPIVVLWALIGFLLTGWLLYEIIGRWNQATGTDFALKIRAATAVLDELDKAREKAAQANAAEIEARSQASSTQDEQARKDAEQNVKKLSQEAATQRAEMEKAEKKANLTAVETIQVLRKGGASEDAVLRMVILLGALGGSLHFVSSLVKFVGNRQLMRSWLLYYLSIPVTSAALAPVVYMMLRIGILAPSGVSNNGSGIANLNLIGIYAFAALTGLFAKTATDKLGEVFQTLFRTAEAASKDPIGSKKPPGGAASAVGQSP